MSCDNNNTDHTRSRLPSYATEKDNDLVSKGGVKRDEDDDLEDPSTVSTCC